ncbi:hypothetical protein SteCoe_30135 [Stentor coeruleus]|uniref:Nuclear condensin complex subunit 3 C-terminal domain-containing protein n=1 Tax=Stentor coeruleus TaxID=5963 RepID=A0A1R2B4A3_9CILI|nr:hypothetical protein SteCoe_30135 [Stentor coeruleus]
MALKTNTLYNQVHEEFSKAIEFKISHKVFMNLLHSAMLTDCSIFCSALNHILHLSLASLKESPKSEAVLKFFKAFLIELKSLLSSESKNIEIYEICADSILSIFTTYLDLKDPISRSAACSLIETFLSLDLIILGNISYQVQKEFTSHIKSLINDSFPKVRFSIIGILSRLGFSDILLTLLNDSIPKNRLKTIKYLPNENHIIKSISEKLCDSDFTVLIATVEKLFEYGFDKLDLDVKKKLIYTCVKQRHDKVRNVAMRNIENVIKNMGIIEFIDSFNVMTFNIKEQGYLLSFLREFFTRYDEDTLKLEISNKLLPELLNRTHKVSVMICSRVAVSVLHKKNENVLFEILPYFKIIELLNYYCTPYPELFTQSILQICMCLDIGEEIIRKKILEVLIKLSTKYRIQSPDYKNNKLMENFFFKSFADEYFYDCSLEVIALIVKSIKSLLDQYKHEFSSIMSEILNEITDPLNCAMAHDDRISEDFADFSLIQLKKYFSEKVSEIDDVIDQLRVETENALKIRDIKAAIQFKSEIDKKTNEALDYEQEYYKIEEMISARYYQALVITTEMLKEVKHGSLVIDINDIVENLILPTINMNQQYIQIKSIECLAQCCIHSNLICTTYFNYFTKIISKQSDSLLELIAIGSIIDMYFVWDIYRPSHDSDISHDDVLNLLIKYTQSSNPYIKFTTLEGLGKLALHNRVQSSFIFSILMLAYFDTSSPDYTKQLLNLIFSYIDIDLSKYSDHLTNAFKIIVTIFSTEIVKNNTFNIIDFTSFNLNQIFSYIWKKISNFVMDSNPFSIKIDFFYYLASSIVAYPKLPLSFIYANLISQIDMKGLNDCESLLALRMMKKIEDVMKTKIVKDCCEWMEKIVMEKDAKSGKVDKLEKVLKKRHEVAVKLVGIFISSYAKKLKFVLPEKERNKDFKRLPKVVLGSLHKK